MDVIMPACVAMFTEEVGVSPLAGDGGLLYQARVAELVTAGRSFARIENGRVVFKAEIGAATPHACQIQGVWVAPEHRGRGLSETGMAAVLRYALGEVAPVVSLYVNDFNTAARAAYRRVGFREVGAFMSVLF
ncbi:N-acetyltransferase GCN5 OS=Streptomyces antimycoticus OX=68175 GN=SANT12839_067670 PE=4 SV=1 [Streptomyces antimycoticus]